MNAFEFVEIGVSREWLVSWWREHQRKDAARKEARRASGGIKAPGVMTGKQAKAPFSHSGSQIFDFPGQAASFEQASKVFGRAGAARSSQDALDNTTVNGKS